MKDFDINSIGKKMPYAAPTNEFFEDFTHDLMKKIDESRPATKRISLRQIVLPIISAAALIVVGMMLTLRLQGEDSVSQIEAMVANNNVDESLDLYFESLSDDQVETLAYEASMQDDFFINLPE